MRVVLDFTPVLRKRYSGFRTYGQGLLKALVERPEPKSILLLCSPDQRQQIDAIPAAGDTKCRIVSPPLRLRRLERWWRWISWPKLQKLTGPFDVYHSFHHLMPPTGPAPRVLTVYDMRRYRLPDLYSHSKTDLFERSVSAADRLLAISQATRDDLVELLDVPQSKVDVATLGTPEGFAPLDEEARTGVARWISQKLDVPIGAYALTLSSRDPRKNLDTCVAAMARACGRLPDDFRLLVVGHLPHGQDLTELARNCGAENRVLATGPLSDAEYQHLLGAAEMLLFLSRYEGFGLPLCEAMAAGVPIIAADISSIPEVAGEGQVLVGPDDVETIADEMVRLHNDPDAREQMKSYGLDRVQQFTWARAAEQTLSCYQRAMAGA